MMPRKAVWAGALLSAVVAATACGSTPLLAADEIVVPNVFVTAYSWHDNTPQGSPTISHPVLHRTAGGTGTYDDPVTVAVGHSRETGTSVLDIPAGTRIYLPGVRRYFIVEDTCGDGPNPQDGPCHTGAGAYGNASLWIDLWIGGAEESAPFVHRCAADITGVKAAVLNPGRNYSVASGTGVLHDGICDTGYGDTLLSR
jgi:3D (Asp-Asp-Asp) domain-containing protein